MTNKTMELLEQVLRYQEEAGRDISISEVADALHRTEQPASLLGQ